MFNIPFRVQMSIDTGVVFTTLVVLVISSATIGREQFAHAQIQFLSQLNFSDPNDESNKRALLEMSFFNRYHGRVALRAVSGTVEFDTSGKPEVYLSMIA